MPNRLPEGRAVQQLLPMFPPLSGGMGATQVPTSSALCLQVWLLPSLQVEGWVHQLIRTYLQGWMRQFQDVLIKKEQATEVDFAELRQRKGAWVSFCGSCPVVGQTSTTWSPLMASRVNKNPKVVPKCQLLSLFWG